MLKRGGSCKEAPRSFPIRQRALPSFQGQREAILAYMDLAAVGAPSQLLQ